MRKKVACAGQLAAAGSCRLLCCGLGDSAFLALCVVQIGLDRVINDRVTVQNAHRFHGIVRLYDGRLGLPFVGVFQACNACQCFKLVCCRVNVSRVIPIY